MTYQQNALRFECTGCGNCCTGRGNYYIEVTAEEQRRIQRHLGVSWPWFRRRYVFKFDDTIRSLRMERNGRCVFLDLDNHCRIYPVRPAQCRHYPFWPELVMRPSAWHSEARRCEGIGRGQVVPRVKIERLLKKQDPL